MSTTIQRDAQSGVGKWVVTGAMRGILAGILFLAFEMLVAGIMGPSPFGPPRMIGATVLGQGALPMPQPPNVGLATVVPVALVVHFVLSAIYGAVFGAIASAIGVLCRSRGLLVVAASVFGLVLWLVNFYVVAPVLFPWFLMANPVVQFLAHTFFFGTALGLLLASRVGDEE
ncbi:MAG: hypothetical protein M3R38_26065 [Actinomycetota bacterium]|nr:hypothetical protein [Actinomycetota bacterium]